MGPLRDLLSWWNLIFALPIALSALLLLLSAVGGLGDGDGDAEADVSPDADTADVDGSGGHTEGDTEANAVGDGHHPLGDALRFLGVGAVPVSLLAQAFLLFFGVFGLAANQMLSVAADPDARVYGALALATLGGAAGTGALGALGRRFIPNDLPAVGNKDLIGKTGRVVFTVTTTEGTIQVRDAGGTLHQIAARIPRGENILEAGQDVFIVGYDAAQGAFLVDEDPFTLRSDELKNLT